MNNKELEKYLIDSKIAKSDGLGGYVIRVDSLTPASTGNATEATLLSVLNELNKVNKIPDFFESPSDGATPIDVTSFSILFRGDGGSLNGVSVPDGYTYNNGNGIDPITDKIPYTVPTSGEKRVLISTLS